MRDSQESFLKSKKNWKCLLNEIIMDQTCPPPGKPTDFQAAVSAMLGRPGVCGQFQITYLRKMVIMMITKTMGIIITIIITSLAL